ncbi:MAG: septum formation initiator family protein, partial [Deltaproteobacteria bacterium]|nr:septum formation initiator family protein [Deltaproteobacteria bacterium]
IAAWLVFGEYGLTRLHRKEMERQTYLESIRRLDEENRALIKEINRLRNDKKYIEGVVRKELHLVKPDEMVYRFKKEEAEESDATRLPMKTQRGDEKDKQKR